jgi:hypothetical protein
MQLTVQHSPQPGQSVWSLAVGWKWSEIQNSLLFFLFESEFVFHGAYRRSTEADMYVTYYA